MQSTDKYELQSRNENAFPWIVNILPIVILLWLEIVVLSQNYLFDRVEPTT